jgi:hypothetical protein
MEFFSDIFGKNITQPVNSGYSNVVQNEIDNLVASQAHRSSEAVQVDGHVCYVWAYQKGSKKCICKTSKLPKVDDFAVSDTTNINTIHVTNSQDSKIHPTIRLKDMFDGQQTELQDKYLDMKPVITSEDDDVMESEMILDDELDGNTYENLEDEVYAWLTGTSGKNPCGICGGSGYLDSYVIRGSERIILDINSASFSGEILDSVPPSVSLKSGDIIAWKLEIPYYWVSYRYRVRNNYIDSLPNVEIKRESDLTWVELIFVDLNDYRGETVDVRLYSDYPFTVSHCEFLFNTVEPFRVQLPQFDRDLGDENTIEALINTSFELDPTVGKIPRKTLIDIPNLCRMFKTTTVNNKETSKLALWNISGSCRVIQIAEPEFLLTWGNGFTQISDSYNGLRETRSQAGLTGSNINIDYNSTSSTQNYPLKTNRDYNG